MLGFLTKGGDEVSHKDIPSGVQTRRRLGPMQGFLTKRDMKSHMKITHPEPWPEGGKVQCRMSYYSKREPKARLKIPHPESLLFIKRSVTLLTVLLILHTVSPLLEVSLKCKTCGKLFSSKKTMFAHLRSEFYTFLTRTCYIRFRKGAHNKHSVL